MIKSRQIDWQTRLPGSVPVTCRRMHRVFWVPRRYARLIAFALSGPFTIRAAAARSGYSTHGAWAAIQSIAEMGIARFDSTLGSRGSTRMTLSTDASLENVPSTVTPREIETDSDATEQGTFDREAYDAQLRRLIMQRLGIAGA